jgi:asparagine synthetase B (glutamine-hydrolysing)
MAARDRVGRRSLLLALDREEAAAEARGAALCSAQVTHALGADGRVGTELEHPLSAAVWHELPCSGLFTTVVPAAGAASMHFLPWTTLSAHHPAAHASHNPYRLPSHTPLSALPALPASLRPLLAALPLPAQHALRRLSEAVRRHVVALPVPDPDADAPDAGVAPVAVLFSGGLDCALLAALLHHHLPAHAPVDLVNVAFQGEATDAFVDATVPDRVAALLAWADLERCCPARQWRYDHRYYTDSHPSLPHPLSPLPTD